MADRLVVGEDTAMGDQYLCGLLDDKTHGHGAGILPAMFVLRMLRFPDQHAIAAGWKDRALSVSPLRAGDVVRLRILREATRTDSAALTWFRDYAASVRFCAFDAMRDAAPGERFRIAMQLTGPPRKPRSVCLFTLLEKLELGDDAPCETHGGT